MQKLLAILPILVAGCGASSHPPSAAPTSAAPSPTAVAADGFDRLVREDFFTGFSGDADALARAMKRCEDELARDPEHAEAMVWHGAGLLFASGQAFTRGDNTAGMTLWQRGMAEENRAVELAPENVGVRIPRGAVFLTMAAFVPDPTTQHTLLATGVADYEKTLGLQAAYFASLSEHARGQLLFGLADGWDRLGDHDAARGYYRRMASELPGSDYADRAERWLAGTPSTEPAPCGECHAARERR